MITEGSLNRNELVEDFPFLEPTFSGRRSAIKEFTHLVPDTIGKNAPEGIKCKAAIHWVSATYAVDAEVRVYDRLFKEENPDAAEDGFMSCLNEDSLSLIEGAKLEPILADVPAGYICQFERLGYFCTDSEDHGVDGKLVFNKTAGLRDNWK